MKKFLLKPYTIFFISLLLAIIGHSFYIYRFFKDGTIMTGPNDGLEQMLPMQLYLYQKFVEGKMFYSMDFGLGGDYYTDLSYYYSTSVIFFLNMIAVRFLDLFFNFNTDTVTFWAKNAFYISIAKSTAAIFISYFYFRKIKMNISGSLLAAFLFLASAIYFRFTIYWSFFSDVFIFLPLLLLGIERFIQDRKKGLFILAVALTFINNFYFAYYQVLAGLLYFIVRNIFVSQYDKTDRKTQWLSFFIMSVLGAGISLFSFFYGVKSFMQNERAEFKDPIPLFSPFDQHANIFYDNYLVIVLFLAVQAICTPQLYRHYFYRLLAVMSIVLMILTTIPYIDSVFNGFSAPQKRWHYLLTFTSSGLIGYYLTLLHSVKLKNYMISAIPGFIIVIASHLMIHKALVWVYIVPVVILLGALYIYLCSYQENRHYVRYRNICYSILLFSVIILNLEIVRSHHLLDNYNPGINDRAKMSYIESSVYDSPLQRHIVEQFNKKLKPGERIDWRVLEQDNTPMYQNFNGVSLYSSIFDGSIIDFYYNDLKINLKEESISRYSTFQSRSNLESLFNVKYLIRKKYQTDIPENFKKVYEDDKYHVYENTAMLPFARITDTIYNKDDLKTPLDREHAMINGMVSETSATNKELELNENLKDQVKITASSAKWLTDDTLKVDPPSGGLIIKVPQKYLKDVKDVYLEMDVTLKEPITRFQINVNGYANNRLFQTSKYRTHQDSLLYRVKKPKSGNLLVGLSPGKYKINIRGIYTEDYKTLKSAVPNSNYHFNVDGNEMTFKLDKSSKGWLTAPIMYRDGMQAFVDGKKVKPVRANYLMTAVPVKENTKNVTLKYRPPYFFLTVAISFISLLLSILYIYYKEERWRKIVSKNKGNE